MAKNLFIAFEGIDGSGKSTQINLLKKNFENAGHNVYTTFEPTDKPIGKLIRDIFNHKSNADQRTIAALFAADRLEHILNKENGIIKMLKEGFTVITDRFYLSSYAYHGVHVPVDWVIQCNMLSAELIRPDLNIFIDIDPELGMKRLKKGRNSLEMFETLENQKKVRDKYFEIMEKLKFQEKIFVTDGNRPVELIAEDIWKVVENILDRI
ncbi:MAG TPA: dTMP kinase [Bacteroidales bacterium]|nr:dTMP kinase [Bacteroidales bacterium]HOG66247.1 dTMP kinase [Bacteroidales bacterium]HPA12908.1 dTMP kinase [Bacteroidales bacterium]HQO07871.1 dTMP kinase [Bacteroidales bacterium]HQP53939.1 dTMP kinase [Bacteroidales bacterium]